MKRKLNYIWPVLQNKSDLNNALDRLTWKNPRTPTEINSCLTPHYNPKFWNSVPVHGLFISRREIQCKKNSSVCCTRLLVPGTYPFTTIWYIVWWFALENMIELIELAAEQSSTDYPYTVVMRQCLVLQCEVPPSSVANATLHVNEIHLLLVAVV